ncbi:glycosyltransferase family 4 protein [Paraneptunicella aestuarii]|uniref:MraY family glycosyltransferase n=1 Tax=Paraneptunicella aestuarii TaxID=2831148 RepID=UPI001E491913|nr:glycosyltransferase family 4 protein [Paraneptunicella aestuarii]UAA39669.1 glycosyltransferase family 4 protein [Paraneptunicella aestuarii]
MLDVPNERSSHQVPTPRGGGAALIVTYFIGLVAIYVKDVITNPMFLALILGGGFIAWIGWIDDKRGVAAKWRLLVQSIAAVFALIMLHDVPELPFVDYFPWLEYVGYVVAAVAIVWSTNLFNFMDGINGLAGFEALFVSFGAAIILYTSGEDFHTASLLVLSFSTLGFLIFNFPKARIFMGDVGSSFLGFTMAIYAIGASSEDVISPWSWVILYGYFVVDSTITLITRMLTGQRWLAAHNLHAYQKWTRKLGSHTKVTLFIFIINVVWLFPMAWLATRFYDYSFFIAIAALLPIAIGVTGSKAGVKGVELADLRS